MSELNSRSDWLRSGLREEKWEPEEEEKEARRNSSSLQRRRSGLKIFFIL